MNDLDKNFSKTFHSGNTHYTFIVFQGIVIPINLLAWKQLVHFPVSKY